MTLAHFGAGGWLDAFIELGLPLLIFIGLFLWSRRKERSRGAGERRE